MRNFYKNEIIMSRPMGQRRSSSEIRSEFSNQLTLNLTDEQLLDSDANQLDLAQVKVADYRESFQDDETKGIYPPTTNQSENDPQSDRQQPYVDFEIFYDALTKARITGLINKSNYQTLNERAKGI